jgi:hypothetical protein
MLAVSAPLSQRRRCRLTQPPLLAVRIAALAAGCVWLTSLADSATAQQSPGVSRGQPKAVLELYTSQGCSSCPAADALFERYAKRGDLVALTLHVDYWDYLGWKDTLANPKFSARQRAYAKARGDGRIYTPQLVVNGSAHVVGNASTGIDKAIETTAAKGSHRISVHARVEGERLVVEIPEAAGASSEATVWLAVVQGEAEVAVRSGENRGRSLKYFNVVRDLTPIGMWTGKAARLELARETFRVAGANGCAVLVQSGKGGEIIGASMLSSGC